MAVIYYSLSDCHPTNAENQPFQVVIGRSAMMTMTSHTVYNIKLQYECIMYFNYLLADNNNNN